MRPRVNPKRLLFPAAVIAAGIIALVVVLASRQNSTPPQTSSATLRIGPGQSSTGQRPIATTPVVGTAAEISAGDYETCSLVRGGAVDCWGHNAHGQLGDATTTDSLTPITSSLRSGGESVSVGGSHVCAVRSGGVLCWGANPDGQLGNGTTTDSSVPLPVSGLQHGVSSVSAGVAHTCAVLSSGSVDCWGANSNGQLGNGSTTDSSTPVAVSGLQGRAVAIAAGLAHTCALLETGIVECWGSNSNGQLGDGKALDSSVPVPVVGLSGAASISAGDAHTCARLRDGKVMCWGWNIEGQLGDGSGADSSVPVPVTGLGGKVTAITTGGSHTCALEAGGSVMCWGANLYGQLGNGTTADSQTPVAVIGLQSGVVTMDAGLYDTCALLMGGAATCWGWSAQGQLGTGSTIGSSAPTNVTDLGLARDGSGTMVAEPRAVPSAWRGNTIAFTFTAAAGGIHSGTVAVIAPTGWSLPSTGPHAAGYSISSRGRLSTSGRTITVTGLVLGGGQRLTVTYGSTGGGGPGADAPTAASSIWRAQEQSSASGTLSALATTPRVDVLSKNGSGALITKTAEVPNGGGHTLVFTYIAASGGLSGGTVAIQVPRGWSQPSTNGADRGFTTSSTGVTTISKRVITVGGVTLRSGRALRITYGSKARGGPGATTPQENAGTQTWLAEERSSGAGRLDPLASSPQINVLSASGSGSMTSSVTAVSSGAGRQSIAFTYLADVGGLSHGSVSITVPDGWSPPSIAPGRGGFASASTGKVTIAGRTITVGVKALASGQSLTITYGAGRAGASAPSSDVGRQTWQAGDASSAGGALRNLGSSPQINVLSPDGAGRLARATGSVVKGSVGNTVVFIYIAGSGGIADGELTLTVPAGWSAPSTGNQDAGYSIATAGNIVVRSRTIVVSHLYLAGGGVLTVIYGSRTAGGPGSTASRASVGPTTWPTEERSTPAGILRALKG